MCIFNLLPDLMEQRMGKFFDIVTSAEEHYWKTDTFRRAFIRLLDFYISELYDEVANTTDVKRPDFCNVFKALAIQLLLPIPRAMPICMTPSSATPVFTAWPPASAPARPTTCSGALCFRSPTRWPFQQLRASAGTKSTNFLSSRRAFPNR